LEELQRESIREKKKKKRREKDLHRRVRSIEKNKRDLQIKVFEKNIEDGTTKSVLEKIKRRRVLEKNKKRDLRRFPCLSRREEF
jgi:hypothetical protein